MKSIILILLFIIFLYILAKSPSHISNVSFTKFKATPFRKRKQILIETNLNNKVFQKSKKKGNDSYSMVLEIRPNYFYIDNDIRYYVNVKLNDAVEKYILKNDICLSIKIRVFFDNRDVAVFRVQEKYFLKLKLLCLFDL